MTDTRVVEIADDVFQLTTYVDEADMGFNQYLVVDDEPLLFHTGMRSLFETVAEAARHVVGVDQLRWISFGHVEADECGAMNEWLGIAPAATVAHGQIGCMVSVGDLADRPPHPLADGGTLELGSRCVEWIDTPHVPHAWEAGLLYERSTKTLFCGDLFAIGGRYPATTTNDIVQPAIEAEDDMPGSLSLHPRSASILRSLAERDIATLALMHGPAFTGDCRAALLALADDFDRRSVAAAS